MKTRSLLISLFVPCLLQAQEVKQAAPPVFKIRDTQQVEMGDRSIFYHLVETPFLKPQEVKTEESPTPEVPLSAEEAEAVRRWESKRQESLFFSITVYDEKVSEVRWWDEGGEYVIWSNINFNYFRHLFDIETDEALYFMMMSLENTSTEQIKAWNAEADRLGLSADNKMPLPQYPLIPSFYKDRSRFIVAAAPVVKTGGLRAMEDLHRYYDQHKAEMIQAYRECEAANKAQEEWAKAHPPIPQDTIINYFPIRSVQAEKGVSK